MNKPTTTRKRIAERYTGPLDESQTAQGIAAIRANVTQLVSAAAVLLSAGIHSLSCALSLLAVEEAQKAMLLLSVFYSDAPQDIQRAWKELRDHRAKHQNVGFDIASCAIVEGTIAPDDDEAIDRKIKEATHPDILEEVKQALIYCDCIVDPNGLPVWSCPVNISPHAAADARRLLESAREYLEHIYPFTEEELRVWKKHMAPARSKPIKDQFEFMKRCEAELRELGLPVPERLSKLIQTSEGG